MASLWGIIKSDYILRAKATCAFALYICHRRLKGRAPLRGPLPGAAAKKTRNRKGDTGHDISQKVAAGRFGSGCLRRGGLCFCRFLRSPGGETVESRQEMLNAAISKGRDWTILKELELEDCVVSAAYSADRKCTLAVFEPQGEGAYRLRTTTTRDADQIIIAGTMANGAWYDLVWFQGAGTEYAEVTYTVGGQEQQPLRFDTGEMEILSIKNPQKEYSMQVVYYDGEGNRYE